MGFQIRDLLTGVEIGVLDCLKGGLKMEIDREKAERAISLLQEWQERKKTDPLLNF